jgi:DNA-binding NarL/FixJ family response regulator
MMVEKLRIVIVDDHALVLESLARRIGDEPDMNVVGTAATGEEGLRQILEHMPDVAVLDVDLPGRSAFDIAADIAAKKNNVKVLFLSGHVSDVFVEQSVRVKSFGYLLKGEPAATLIDGIRQVAAGEVVFSREVSDRLVFDPRQQQYVARTESPISSLTNRQLEVLRHLARGSSVKEVAKTMRLSEKSVDSHKYRIMHKLGIHDRVELARFAIREGLTLP